MLKMVYLSNNNILKIKFVTYQKFSRYLLEKSKVIKPLLELY